MHPARLRSAVVCFALVVFGVVSAAVDADADADAVKDAEGLSACTLPFSTARRSCPPTAEHPR